MREEGSEVKADAKKEKNLRRASCCVDGRYVVGGGGGGARLISESGIHESEERSRRSGSPSHFSARLTRTDVRKLTNSHCACVVSGQKCRRLETRFPKQTIGKDTSL